MHASFYYACLGKIEKQPNANASHEQKKPMLPAPVWGTIGRDQTIWHDSEIQITFIFFRLDLHELLGADALLRFSATPPTSLALFLLCGCWDPLTESFSSLTTLFRVIWGSLIWTVPSSIGLPHVVSTDLDSLSFSPLSFSDKQLIWSWQSPSASNRDPCLSCGVEGAGYLSLPTDCSRSLSWTLETFSVSTEILHFCSSVSCLICSMDTTDSLTGFSDSEMALPPALNACSGFTKSENFYLWHLHKTLW